MKQFLIVAYDGYVGVEESVYTLDQLLSEEQSWRPDVIRKWAVIADVGHHMLAPPGRKDSSDFAIIRVR